MLKEVLDVLIELVDEGISMNGVIREISFVKTAVYRVVLRMEARLSKELISSSFC